MENPGALAGATGASGKAGELRTRDYSEENLDATARHAKTRHKRAAGMILCALVLDPEAPQIWRDAALVLRARLTDRECVGLAFAALRALDPAHRTAVFGAAHRSDVSCAGAPLPPLGALMDDARDWAAWASRAERKAYTLAAFEAMSTADQAAFLRHVQRGAVQ